MLVRSMATRQIRGLRWWIATLLFASTVINYIDRQTLSVLAPYLKTDFGWSNTDFALIVMSFRAAYAIFQTVNGRILDRIGTKNGLSLMVLWYSLAAMLTSTASGIKSFCAMRFLLGAGEAGNWPGATKAVSEWFPKAQRGWAVAIFDSGSAIGAAVAPFLVITLYHSFGSWRPAFLFTGALGLLWLVAWRRLYSTPAKHANITSSERQMILADRGHDAATSVEQASRFRDIAGRADTWGIVIGKALTDPVWFFVTDWFAIFLVSKGFHIETTLIGFWVPFIAADLGNFAGGGISSYLIKRGWSAVSARKAVILVTGIGMASLIPAVYASNLGAIVTLFAISTFCYAAWSTMALTLPADLFPSRAVATVSGMSGTAAGTVTIVSTFLIGQVTDRVSFEPVLIAASIVPLIATAAVFLLIRERFTLPVRG
jgi:MFS transporter, ACS family, hexuronate transporter